MTYLFVCGGTGGHIFPALAVAEELEKRGARVFYVCGGREIEGEIFRGLPKQAVFPVRSAPFRGKSSIADPRFLLKLTQGYFQSRALLKKLRPALVVGFGGYVSFPVLLAARSMGFKTALHEQNVLPGRANRLLSRWVDSVALSHEESLPLFASSHQLKVTGNPIRAAIEKDRREEALASFGFSPAKRTLLVLGGSQGAESVNRLFLSSLPFWEESMKKGLQVLHLCGRMEPAGSEKTCRESGVTARAFSFYDRMDLAYSAADFCLGRAGATFLAEIEAKGLEAILIPYPYADGHQRENARVFAASGRSCVAEQAELTSEKLAGFLRDFYRKPSQKNPVVARPGAREALASFLQECAGS